MTFGDIIVLGVLALAVSAIIRGTWKKKKSGQSCGCGSCKGCAMAGSCHINGE